jgi:hypothetical protein
MSRYFCADIYLEQTPDDAVPGATAREPELVV